MRWIFLSPHLDDAALCAGGLIYERTHAGEVVEIWTVMSGVPLNEHLSEFARTMHTRWGTTSASQTVEVRRLEDMQAASILGARSIHLDFLDAIYRRGPDGAPLYADPVGAPVDPAEGSLPRQICEALRPQLRPDDRVVCLLGIGDHVDHVVVRGAGEMLGVPLRYVADFPYVLRHPDSVAGKTAGLTGFVQPISRAAAEAWTRGVEAYRSQLKAVFEELDVRASIEDYWAASKGIRTWRRDAAAAVPGFSSPRNSHARNSHNGQVP
jgi:LmbE family N-acetylglucosaminyl deacetylase